MKHKHAELMLQYAQDAMTTDKPWELWECYIPDSNNPRWFALVGHPTWGDGNQYRRKPKTHTVVLNTEQLKEIILACEYPDWENENFVGGVAVLRNALGVQPVPKTNAQTACGLLGKAHDELEVHSAIVCEPNVDHIQKLVWDAMQLLTKGEQQ
jgi:hypothetical protein